MSRPCTKLCGKASTFSTARRACLLVACPASPLDLGCGSFYGDTRAERVLGRALKDIARDQVRQGQRAGAVYPADAACPVCAVHQSGPLRLRRVRLQCGSRHCKRRGKSASSGMLTSTAEAAGATCAGELGAAMRRLHRHHPMPRHRVWVVAAGGRRDAARCAAQPWLLCCVGLLSLSRPPLQLSTR